MTSSSTSTYTGGGAHIDGAVAAGGDFIGRDQINITIHQTLPAQPNSEMANSDLVLLNFTRPLTKRQRTQIEQTLGYRIGKTVNIPTEFDNLRDFGPQCVALVEQVGLTAHDWQTLPILVNPPGFVPGALCLLSELHGRMGHFPAIVRLCPQPPQGLPVYDVAELINLQALRDAARRRSSHHA